MAIASTSLHQYFPLLPVAHLVARDLLLAPLPAPGGRAAPHCDAATGTPTGTHRLGGGGGYADGCGGQTELGERGEALPRPREGARFPERGVDLLYRGEARGHDGDQRHAALAELRGIRVG